MKKIFSLLKKRVDLPSVSEVRLIIHSLDKRTKVIFLSALLIFIIGVGGILWLANKYISVEIPASGGTLYEGVVGIPRFINPLITISDADRDIASLVYSGLMRSDGKGNLIPDLAEKYEISEDGTIYTFTLKEGLKWHDGAPVTSDDVAFTIKMVQTPLVKSPKRANWEGVNIEVTDERTIKFILKKPYAPFLENTKMGILPRHIWGDTIPEQLSLSEFNINPVGSGPFYVKKISRNSSGIINSYTLDAFKDYSLGRPYIKRIVLNFYNSEQELLNAYSSGEVSLLGSISPKNIPSDLSRHNSRLDTMMLSRIFGVFFNQNQNKALASIEVRKALSLATDKERIIREVLGGYGSSISNPIPPGTLGAMTDSGTEDAYNLDEARAVLKRNGWQMNEETKILEKKINKETIPLTLSISTSIASDLTQTATLLKEMWEQLGAKVDVRIFEIGDFDKNVIRTRDYNVLLFGEVVGYDPDPFAFWHSSQRNDPGLNIALYANIAVDKILSEARQISDPAERAKKYISFQKELQNDIPAIFLYSPEYIYITPNSLFGMDTNNITMPSERFTNAYKWHMNTKNVWKFFIY